MVIGRLLYRVVIGCEVLLTRARHLRRQVFAIGKTEENENGADGNESKWAREEQNRTNKKKGGGIAAAENK